MTEYLLASAGEQIKFWSVNGLTLMSKWNPYNGGVPALAWAPNNNFIVCLSSTNDTIKIRNLTSDESNDISISNENTKDKYCLAVDSSSRLVMAGGVQGLLHVWDIKSQKLRKTYKHPSITSTMTACQYNQDDTLIAASHETGELIFYNVTSAVATVPTHSNNNKSAIRCLKFSYFRSNLLATVSDDGVTQLWDANNRAHQHTFKTIHNAPATALAFSPHNQMLMLSVGLDKKILCYDVLSKKNIKSMSVDSPLTSIDIFQDGSTVAVGTTRGQIFFYDLRKGATPFMNANAHTTAVHCLSFQRRVTGKLKSNQDAKSKCIPITNSMETSNKEANVEKIRDTTNLNESPVQKKLPMNKSDVGSENIFSPYRDHDSAVTDKTPDRLEMLKLSAERGGRDSLQMMELNRFSDVNNAIFSPIVSDTANNSTNHSSNNHSFTPSEVKLAPLTFDNPEVDLLRLSLNTSFIKDISTSSQMQTQLNNLGTQAIQKMLNSPIQRPLNVTTSKTSAPQNIDNDNINSSDPIKNRYTEFHGTVDTTKINSSMDDELKATSTTNEKFKVHFSDNMPSYQMNSSYPSENETTGISQTYLQGGSFPVEFIRSVIRDEMEEYFEQMHDGIVRLHADMLKRFYQQQIEMQKMMQACSLNPDLVSEIKRLKEENENLKKNQTFSQFSK